MKAAALDAFSMTRADMRHGAQLAAAVAISYLLSGALGLPEGFWAVMSALIVTRPDAGATLGAGWDRIRGTVLGTACGLFGVWLRHSGFATPATTLLVVAALSFASAGVPILRSAPITALIILSSGGIAGHSPLQVAGLRVAEIAIGVSVGLAISVALPAARATTRFSAECAGVLRQIAAQVAAALGETRRSDDEREAASTEMRAELRRLAMLGQSAGQESMLSLRAAWRRLRREPAASGTAPISHARIARLVMRTSQDAALLGRVFDSLPAARATVGVTADSVATSNLNSAADTFWPDLRDAACLALTSTAQALADGSAADLAPLRRFDRLLAARRAASATDDTALLLAGPMRWLIDDLQRLGRIAAVH